MIRAAVRALRPLGAWGLRPIRRRWRPHALVLNYHRIVQPPHDDPWRLCVAPRKFREQLGVLREIAEVVPLAELDARASGSRARPTVALTFDDGYADDVETALPLLDEFRFPATFFITTAAIGGTTPFWWDRLAALVPDARRRETLRGRLLEMDEAARHIELDRIAASTVDVFPAGRAMSVAQLERLARSPLVEIGAHTRTHRYLRHLAPELQRQEIAGSLADCERLTGRRPTSFAYPYGALDACTPALVADCGFARACTTASDLHWRSADPFRIPRFAVGDWDGTRFARTLDWYWLP